MPNWVYSEIEIREKKESGTIQKFIDSGEKDDHDEYTFDSWVPMPEIFHKYDTTNIHTSNMRLGETVYINGKAVIVTDEVVREWEDAEREQLHKYGCIGWYDWSCKYWGTKWNADLDISYLGGSALIMNCTTAWSPPVEFLLEISRRYPDLVIDVKSHDEGGWNSWYILTSGCIGNTLTDLSDEYVRGKLLEQIQEDSELPDKRPYLQRLKEIGSMYDITNVSDEEALYQEYTECVSYWLNLDNEEADSSK